MDNFINTEVIFFENEEAYQMRAYIVNDVATGKVVAPKVVRPYMEYPAGTIVWRGEKIFRMDEGGEVEITEADLPENVKIRGEAIDKYRK